MSSPLKIALYRILPAVWFLFLLVIACLPAASADLGTFPQGQCFEIRTQSVFPQVNISTVTVGNNTIVLNAAMTNVVGDTFSYNFCSTTQLGEYVYDWYPCSNEECVNSFNVTPGGDDLTIPKAIFFIFVLATLLIFLSFSISAINKAEKGEWQIFYICVSYLLLFVIFFLGWLVSKNYLWNLPLLERIAWIGWIVLGGAMLPFLIIIGGYILKREAEKLLVDDYEKQGYSRDEAKELAKSQKRR